MHRMHNVPKTHGGPETAGATIHWASRYVLFTSLLGLGLNRSNSRMVVEMAKIKPGDKVLDVGCGTGSLTLTAKTYAGASGAVHGVDASPEMITLAACRRDKPFANHPTPYDYQDTSPTAILCNADMRPAEVRLYCQLDETGRALMKTAMAQLNLSARAYHRVLKLARTIADLAGAENIAPSHLAEALHYRPKMEMG